MDRRIKIAQHGVTATLVPQGIGYWRILIDEGRGGDFEHAGSRSSAEYRASWECWAYRRLADNPPMLIHRARDRVSAYDEDDEEDQDQPIYRNRAASGVGHDL